MKPADALESRRRRVLPADAAMAAVILLLGLFLAVTGGLNVQRWRSSPAYRGNLGFEDHIGTVANTVGLIVTVWWAMSLAVAVVAAVLERAGKVRAASAAGKFAPAFMRRLALAAVGLQLVTAPLATASTSPSPPEAPASAPVTASAAWTPTAFPATAALPPAVPSATPPGTPVAAAPQWQPLSPVIEPGPLTGPPLRLQQPEGQWTELTVRPGDSLWSLSAARLGPFASDVDIALDWPRLYQANREVIGANPHLLRPGQILRIPPGP